MVHAVLVRETYDLWLSNNKPTFLLKFKILGNTRLLCITTFHVVDVLFIPFLDLGQHWPGDSAHKHTYTHHVTRVDMILILRHRACRRHSQKRLRGPGSFMANLGLD